MIWDQSWETALTANTNTDFMFTKTVRDAICELDAKLVIHGLNAKSVRENTIFPDIKTHRIGVPHPTLCSQVPYSVKKLMLKWFLPPNKVDRSGSEIIR